MTRTQRFGFSFDMSVDFLAQEPGLAQQWIDARRAEIAKVRLKQGPRGGHYRLTLQSLTIPVRDGSAILPDGRTVESQSKAVVVPVPPSDQ